MNTQQATVKIVSVSSGDEAGKVSAFRVEEVKTDRVLAVITPNSADLQVLVSLEDGKLAGIIPSNKIVGFLVSSSDELVLVYSRRSSTQLAQIQFGRVADAAEARHIAERANEFVAEKRQNSAKLPKRPERVDLAEAYSSGGANWVSESASEGVGGAATDRNLANLIAASATSRPLSWPNTILSPRLSDYERTHGLEWLRTSLEHCIPILSSRPESRHESVGSRWFRMQVLHGQQTELQPEPAFLNVFDPDFFRKPNRTPMSASPHLRLYSSMSHENFTRFVILSENSFRLGDVSCHAIGIHSSGVISYAHVRYPLKETAAAIKSIFYRVGVDLRKSISVSGQLQAPVLPDQSSMGQ